MGTVPAGVDPRLFSLFPGTPDAPEFVQPGPPTLPSGGPAPIGYVGYVDPASVPSLDTSDVDGLGMTRIWSIDDPTKTVFRPGEWLMKPSHAAVRRAVEKGEPPEQRLVSFIYDEQKDDIDETIREPSFIRFTNWFALVTAEEANWLLSHPQHRVWARRDNLDQWLMCPMASSHNCTFAAKCLEVRDEHVRRSHGG